MAHGNSDLLDRLTDRIGSITNKCLERFQNTATTAGLNLATSTGGYLIDAMPGATGIGGVLNAGVDTTFGLIKNMRAIHIVTDTKEAIREIAQMASTVTSGTIFESKLKSSFKTDGFESDGEKLLSALRAQDYIKDGQINYQDCNSLAKVNLDEITFDNNLATAQDYKARVKSECGYVNSIMLFEYESESESEFKVLEDNFVGLVSGTIKEIRTQSIVKPVVQGTVQAGSLVIEIEQSLVEAQKRLDSKVIII